MNYVFWIVVAVFAFVYLGGKISVNMDDPKETKFYLNLKNGKRINCKAKNGHADCYEAESKEKWEIWAIPQDTSGRTESDRQVPTLDDVGLP